MSNSLPLSNLTYEIVSWPASQAAISNPVETIKPIVELITSKTPYPMRAGITTKTNILKCIAVVGWESTAAHTAAARGTPEAFEALKRALAPSMADPSNLKVDMLHSHWPADPAKHFLAPLVELGIAKPKDGTSAAEAQATIESVQKAFNVDAAARGIVAEMMLGTLEEKPGEWAFIVGYESEKVPDALLADEKTRALFTDAESKLDISLTFAELKKYA